MTLELGEWVDIYKALGDKTRLHILALLSHGELCVCELVDLLNMSQPAISQHLRKRKQVGLVRERKAGQWVYYRLDGDDVPMFSALMAQLPNVSAEIEGFRAGEGPSCTVNLDIRS